MKAGKIDVSYENGFLRYFMVNQTEVLRMVYFAVRDSNWGNFEPYFFDEEIEKKDDSFNIKYKVKYAENGTDFFKWNVEISGMANNEIHFEIEGETLEEFYTNRAGLCVLHPIENIAGKNTEIIHSNGQTKMYSFPNLIAPHQPFIDISEMKWEVENNEFELHFSGDIFETEDQRNWGDASYKTYCTPLHLPFPKLMNKGNKVNQKVRFLARLNEENQINRQSEKQFEKSNFSIGICASVDLETLSEISIQKIKALNLNQYHIIICPSENHWIDYFLQQCAVSKELHLPLDITLNLSKNYKEELTDFLTIVDHNRLNISQLSLISLDGLVTKQPIIDEIPNLKKHLKSTKIGIGTNYNFTEINRNRFEVKEADFISLSFNPQEHASDDLSILENAETVKYIVESVKEIYQKPVHFSPIMLKRRFNPYATDQAAINIPIENQLDARQKTDFLADWTQLIFENLSKSGVASVNIFQTAGALGLMDENGNEYLVYQAIKKR